MTSATQTPPAPKPKAAGTEYVILVRSDEGSWREATDTRTAVSAAAAVKAYLGASQAAGTFVAVPLRNWRPVTSKVETRTTIKLEAS